MLTPDSVTVPAPSLVKLPVLVVIGSATVILPAPPKVKLNVPVMPSPDVTSKVSVVPLSALIRASAAKVIAPA